MVQCFWCYQLSSQCKIPLFYVIRCIHKKEHRYVYIYRCVRDAPWSFTQRSLYRCLVWVLKTWSCFIYLTFFCIKAPDQSMPCSLRYDIASWWVLFCKDSKWDWRQLLECQWTESTTDWCMQAHAWKILRCNWLVFLWQRLPYWIPLRETNDCVANRSRVFLLAEPENTSQPQFVKRDQHGAEKCSNWGGSPYILPLLISFQLTPSLEMDSAQASYFGLHFLKLAANGTKWPNEYNI